MAIDYAYIQKINPPAIAIKQEANSYDLGILLAHEESNGGVAFNFYNGLLRELAAKTKGIKPLRLFAQDGMYVEIYRERESIVAGFIFDSNPGGQGLTLKEVIYNRFSGTLRIAVEKIFNNMAVNQHNIEDVKPDSNRNAANRLEKYVEEYIRQQRKKEEGVIKTV